MDGWSGMGGRVGRQAVAWIGLSQWMDKQMELGGGWGTEVDGWLARWQLADRQGVYVQMDT